MNNSSSFAGLFLFKSRKERERERLVLEKKVYPLGEEQKKWDRQMLDVLFPKRKDKELLLFSLLEMKRLLAEGKAEEASFTEITEAWLSNPANTDLAANDKKLIISMAELEAAAETFDALPEAEDIRKLAEGRSDLRF